MAKESDKELLNEAKERLKLAKEADKVDRDQSIEDLRFTGGDQWDPVRRAEREEAMPPRPCLTSNRILQYLRGVENDVRQNRPEIRAIPDGEDATIAVANIYTGILRHIQYQSNAGIVYSMAVHNQGACGRGWIRVITDFSDEESMDQEIKLIWVPDPHSISWDPAAKGFFLEDMKYAFIEQDIPKTDFKDMYPDVPLESLDTDREWADTENVKVAEYFRVVDVEKKKIYKLSDGTIAYSLQPGQEAAMTRTVYKKVVEWRKICGSAVLEGPIIFPGGLIPLVPVWGDIFYLDGKIRRFGMTYHAKDEQRAYNYARSSCAELIGLAPLQPWMGTKKMFGDNTHMWNIRQSASGAPLLYDTDPTNPQLTPKRVEPPIASSALISELEWAGEGIKANFGKYDASLGAVSNETSGKAILARQKAGDTVTYNFPDNFNMALWHLGRIIFDMIPIVYDTERTVKMLNEDDSEKIILINKIVDPQTGKKENDISIGRYSVKVVTGPSYNTKRQETAEAMLQIVGYAPDQLPIIGDILFSNLDWNKADVVAKRFKKMLPAGLAEDENGEPVQQPPDPQAMALMQHQAELAELEKAIKEQELEQKELQNEKLAVEIQLLKQKGELDAVQGAREERDAQSGREV